MFGINKIKKRLAKHEQIHDCIIDDLNEVSVKYGEVLLELMMRIEELENKKTKKKATKRSKRK